MFCLWCFLLFARVSGITWNSEASLSVEGREANTVRGTLTQDSCSTFFCKVCIPRSELALFLEVDSSALNVNEWCSTVQSPLLELPIELDGWSPSHVRKTSVNLYVRDDINWQNAADSSEEYLNGMLTEVSLGLDPANVTEIGSESDGFVSGFLSGNLSEILSAGESVVGVLNDGSSTGGTLPPGRRRNLQQAVSEFGPLDSTLDALRFICEDLATEFKVNIYEPNSKVVANSQILADSFGDLFQSLQTIPASDDFSNFSIGERAAEADFRAIEDRCIAKGVVEIASRCLSLDSDTNTSSTFNCVQSELRRVSYDTSYTLQTIYNKNLIFWRNYLSQFTDLEEELNYTETLGFILDDIAEINTEISKRTQGMEDTYVNVQSTTTNIINTTIEQEFFLNQTRDAQLVYYNQQVEKQTEILDTVSDVANVLYGLEVLLTGISVGLRDVSLKNLAYIQVVAQRGAQAGMLLSDIAQLVERVRKDNSAPPALHKQLMAAIELIRQNGWEPWFYSKGAPAIDPSRLNSQLRGPAVVYLRYDPTSFMVKKYVSRIFCDIKAFTAESRVSLDAQAIDLLFSSPEQLCVMTTMEYEAQVRDAPQVLGALSILYQSPWLLELMEIDAVANNIPSVIDNMTSLPSPEINATSLQRFRTQKLGEWWSLRRNRLLLDTFGPEGGSQHLPWCNENKSLVIAASSNILKTQVINSTFSTSSSSSSFFFPLSNFSSLAPVVLLEGQDAEAFCGENSSNANLLNLVYFNPVTNQTIDITTQTSWFGWKLVKNETLGSVEQIHNWLSLVSESQLSSLGLVNQSEISYEVTGQGIGTSTTFSSNSPPDAVFKFGRPSSAMRVWCNETVFSDNNYTGDTSFLVYVGDNSTRLVELFEKVWLPTLNPLAAEFLPLLSKLLEPQYLGHGAGQMCGSVSRRSAIVNRQEFAAGWSLNEDLLSPIPSLKKIETTLPMPSNCSLWYSEQSNVETRYCNWNDRDHSNGLYLEFASTISRPYQDITENRSAEARQATQSVSRNGYVLDKSNGAIRFFYDNFISNINIMRTIAEQAAGDLAGSWPSPLYLATGMGREPNVEKRQMQKKYSAEFLMTSPTEEAVWKATKRVRRLGAFPQIISNDTTLSLSERQGGLLSVFVTKIFLENARDDSIPSTLQFVGNPYCWDNPCYYRPTKLKKIGKNEYVVREAFQFGFDQPTDPLVSSENKLLCGDSDSDNTTSSSTTAPELWPLSETNGFFPYVFDIDQEDFRSMGTNTPGSPLSFFRMAEGTDEEKRRILSKSNSKVLVQRVRPLHSYRPVTGEDPPEIHNAGISPGDLISRITEYPDRCTSTSTPDIRESLNRRCNATFSTRGTGLCALFERFYIGTPGKRLPFESTQVSSDSLRLYPKKWSMELTFTFDPNYLVKSGRHSNSTTTNITNTSQSDGILATTNPPSSNFNACPEIIQVVRNAQGTLQVRMTNLAPTRANTRTVRITTTCDDPTEQPSGPTSVIIKPLSTTIVELETEECLGRRTSIFGADPFTSSQNKINYQLCQVNTPSTTDQPLPPLITTSDNRVSKTNAVRVFSDTVETRVKQATTIMQLAIRNIIEDSRSGSSVQDLEAELRLLLTNYTIEALNNSETIEGLEAIANGNSYWANQVLILEEAERQFLLSQQEAYVQYLAQIEAQRVRVNENIVRLEQLNENRTQLWSAYQELLLLNEVYTLAFEISRKRFIDTSQQLEDKMRESLLLLQTVTGIPSDCCDDEDIVDQIREFSKAETFAQRQKEYWKNQYDKIDGGIEPELSDSSIPDKRLDTFFTTLFILLTTLFLLNLIFLCIAPIRKEIINNTNGETKPRNKSSSRRRKKRDEKVYNEIAQTSDGELSDTTIASAHYTKPSKRWKASRVIRE